MPFKDSPPRVVAFCAVDALFRIFNSRSMGRTAQALQQAAKAGIAIVLCSDKARAELESIRHELEIRDPFVVEGGAAAFIPIDYFGGTVPSAVSIPGYEVLEFGAPHAQVVRILHETADATGVAIVRFGEMLVEEVARECGIGLLRAQLAKLRDYVEPYRIVDPTPDARGRFVHALQLAGVRSVTRGQHEYAGAFSGLSPSITALRSLYRRTFGPVATLGMVDTTGDDSLFKLVDRSVDVCGDGSPAGCGLTEWAESICDVVEDLLAGSPGRRLPDPRDAVGGA